MTATIIKGQPDWQTPINQFMAGNAINYSDWSSTGVSLLNGFSSSTSNTLVQLRYRQGTVGTHNIVQVQGWINTPALTSNKDVNAFMLPTSILPASGTRLLVLSPYSWITANEQLWIHLADSTSSTFTCTLLGNDTAAGSASINLTIEY